MSQGESYVDVGLSSRELRLGFDNLDIEAHLLHNIRYSEEAPFMAFSLLVSTAKIRMLVCKVDDLRVARRIL